MLQLQVENYALEQIFQIQRRVAVLCFCQVSVDLEEENLYQHKRKIGSQAPHYPRIIFHNKLLLLDCLNNHLFRRIVSEATVLEYVQQP